MTFDQAKSYVHKQIVELDASYNEFEVQLMGGEPLLVFPLIKELTEWLWQQQWPIPLKQVFAPTNGTVLTPEIKEWLITNKHKICLGLSFDGDSNMQNMNRSSSFCSVDLKFFASIWPKQSVKMTLSPDTIHLLYTGVLFLNEQGFEFITADLAMGDKVVWETRHLSEFAKQLKLLTDYYVKNPHAARISLLDIDVINVLKKSKIIKKCGCGEDLVCIDCDGQIYACHLFSPISSPQCISKMSQSIDFSEHNSFANETCLKCLLFPLCTSCYGMNYLLTGNLSEQAPFTCKAFKIQFLSACNLQLKIAELNKEVKQQKLIKNIISQFQKNENINIKSHR